MSSSDCCSSRSRNILYNDNNPIYKTMQMLDGELRLRSIRNSLNSKYNDRFDELTHFFNIINGLFHQSAFTLGLSIYHLAPLLHLHELNVGINMQIDQENNITLYSHFHKQNLTNGIIKFHTIDKNLMFSINHRWTPSLTTTIRFGTKTQLKQLWSHIDYRCSIGTYEFIGEYGTRQQSSSIQFRCLSCLWRRMNLQIDGGIDIKITSKEKLADVALRLNRSSDSFVFKCNLYNPYKNYLIGIQRYINTNCTIGLLIEKYLDNYQHEHIKSSFMSQWHLNTIGLRINTLINTHNEFGISLTRQFHYFPLVLQTFTAYSWTQQKYRWGIGLQILI